MARKWGCKVIALNDLLKELKKLKPLPKKEERNGRGNGKGMGVCYMFVSRFMISRIVCVHVCQINSLSFLIAHTCLQCTS